MERTSQEIPEETKEYAKAFPQITTEETTANARIYLRIAAGYDNIIRCIIMEEKGNDALLKALNEVIESKTVLSEWRAEIYHINTQEGG